MLQRILSPLSGFAFAALRIVAGLLFATHGAQKLFGWYFERPKPEMGTQAWFGGVIELVGGVLIALGLFTRCAAFIASGTMAVAYTQFHWMGDGKGGFDPSAAFTDRILPVVNGGELALLYAFLFLYIACRGPGPASLDARLRKSPA